MFYRLTRFLFGWQLQKFVHVYKQLADMYKTTVQQVVLSLNDKVISSNACPKDLGITVADIIGKF